MKTSDKLTPHYRNFLEQTTVIHLKKKKKAYFYETQGLLP
jgi:hypothetical protein